MSTVTADLTISLDGFVAGPRQSLEHPMGEGARGLHRWQFEQAEENASEVAGIVEAGAFIMGRNMFGPIRGEWSGDWNGWWDDDPPYHAPVFVLTHYPREPLVMQGGTTFTFVTDGVESAMRQARAAAGNASVAIGGGADTVRQFLHTALIDELRLHISPILLHEGERLFDGVGDPTLEPLSVSGTSLVTHVRYRVTYPSATGR